MMLPFHLPIYPQCLVNWLPILLSALYNESNEVQLCINPETQTAHFGDCLMGSNDNWTFTRWPLQVDTFRHNYSYVLLSCTWNKPHKRVKLMEFNYKVPNKLKHLKAFYRVFSEKSVSRKKCRVAAKYSLFNNKSSGYRN